MNIAEYAEEWLTSAQAMGLAQRRGDGAGDAVGSRTAEPVA